MTNLILICWITLGGGRFVSWKPPEPRLDRAGCLRTIPADYGKPPLNMVGVMYSIAVD